MGDAILDLGDYPEIHCYGLGDCYVIGPLVRFTMWDWFRVDAIWRRKIVGSLTRPIAGLEEDQRRSWQAIASIKAPSEHVGAMH